MITRCHPEKNKTEGFLAPRIRQIPDLTWMWRWLEAPQLVPLSEPQFGPLMPQNHSQKMRSIHPRRHNAESYVYFCIHSEIQSVFLDSASLSISDQFQSRMRSPSNKTAQHVGHCSIKLKQRREPHLFLDFFFQIELQIPSVYTGERPQSSGWGCIKATEPAFQKPGFPRQRF